MTQNAEPKTPNPAPPRSFSIIRRRFQKFRRIKRGYYSFLILAGAYVLSFFLPLLINDKALVVKYQGHYFFPIAKFHSTAEFGLPGYGEPVYREMKKQFQTEGAGNWVLMPLYHYGPMESNFDSPGSVPYRPSAQHILGSDDRGRDIFARLAYGLNVSLTFALIVTLIAEGFGTMIGALLGYYGGKLDILGVRFIEIWSSLPFLYTVIIVSSIYVPVYISGRSLLGQSSFWLLTGILVIFDWIGITYYVRGEFYREKSKDYVGAAIALGVSEPKIIFRHILPNALTPVISFAPFTIVGNIVSLVALDFLGFGLPAPTPSWGELIEQGTQYLDKWWLAFSSIGILISTLLLVVFIGEAVREAFDPKEYSRLR
jgi:microcin C transport system permease protein